MSRTHGFLLSLSVACVLPATTPAMAGAQSEQLDEAARLTFESAREAFVAGDYENALARFRQAYQLSQRPGLLYNIAQTLDRLRRDQETVEALRQYQRAAPDAPNRSEVDARIRVLERALAERRTAEPPPSDPVTGRPRPAPSSTAVLHPAIFISAAALTLGGAGVLIWSGTETLALNDRYTQTTTRAEAQVLFDQAESQQLLTNAFIGVTAGLGLLAVALVIFTDWDAFGGSGERAAVQPLFRAGPEGAWLGLGASF